MHSKVQIGQVMGMGKDMPMSSLAGLKIYKKGQMSVCLIMPAKFPKI